MLRGLSSSVAEPINDIVLASPASTGRLQRSPLGVVGDPIQVGSSVEQQLRCSSLACGASVPKSLRQCFAIGAGLTAEKLFKAIEHAEG